MEHLSPEILQLIKSKQELLQKQAMEYAEKQRQSKLNDICTSTQVNQDEASAALSLCENDELEAINRILTEPSFKCKVQEMAKGNTDRFDGEEDIEPNRGDDFYSDEDEDDLDDSGERRRKRKRSSNSMKKDRVPKQVKESVTSQGPKVEGFNADGTPRAPTIRLGDALQRLQAIKRAQQEAAAASAENNKISSSPSSARKSPRKSSSSSSAAAAAAAGIAVVVVASPAKKTIKAAEETVEDESKSAKGKGKKAASPAPSKTASSPEKKKNGTTPKAAVVPKKDDDDYTFEDLKSLEWSDARIKAFLTRKQNPNAYYYRFNAPGEEQRTGGWTKEEHERFMELIKDGVDYHWGMLSIKMPGRVGYQCSNYYRKLVAEAKIVDPNYVVDEKGKLTFVRNGQTKRYRPSSGSGGEEGVGGSGTSIHIADAEPSTRVAKRASSGSKKKKRSSRKRNSDDETIRSSSEEEESDDGQPREYLLGTMQDAMTMKPMKTPAISPFGHVLDYSTWLRLLKAVPQNTCPFTKQRVTRRDLVKLTKGNIEEYRSSMVDTNFEIPLNSVGKQHSSSSMSEDGDDVDSGVDDE
jgi:hypothetical protein